MSKLTYEQLLPFAAAAQSLPGRPHVSTLYRFAMRGIRGIRLETVLVGGRRYTSREALDRFVDRVTAAAELKSEPPPEIGDLSEAQNRALDRDGIV